MVPPPISTEDHYRSPDYWAEPPHDKTNKMACAPIKDSDFQTGHPPSLIKVFAVRMKKAWVLSYPMSAQRRLWSDWVDAQAHLSLRWAHLPFCWFCHGASQLMMQLLLEIARKWHNLRPYPASGIKKKNNKRHIECISGVIKTKSKATTFLFPILVTTVPE